LLWKRASGSKPFRTLILSHEEPAKTFDGLVINDAAPNIGNATLASTNIPGFSSSEVTFNSSNIFVNFPNSFASLDPGATITIDVAPVTATPEPTSLALLLLGVPATLFVSRMHPRIDSSPDVHA
jgi:hypothetical protein